MAEDIHLFQSRRDNTPYFFHVTRVVKIIIDELNITDAEILCGAFLHDALEDSEVLNLETLTYNFGPYISFVVDVLTRFHRLKTDKKEDSNFENYIHRLNNSSLDCVIIKLAERLDNFRCLVYGLKSNPIQYIEETCKFYVPITENFDHPALKKLVELIKIEKSKYFN
jgi:(p)ppGpp synthase/HD superfamily hydrolase